MQKLQTQGLQRIAPAVEEVVQGADIAPLQHDAPDFGGAR